MKTTKNLQSKSNIFGVKTQTPGQNLLEAVTGACQPIGIPSFRMDEALAILTKALNSEELDLVKRGFGIGGLERISQKEIAGIYGVEHTVISAKAHAAIEKLKRSPYKSQLRALAPTVEELCNQYAALEAEKRGSCSRKQLESVTQKLNEANESLKSAEEERLKLEYELGLTTTRVADLTKELQAARTEIARLLSENERNASRAEYIKKAFDEAINGAQIQFIAAIEKAEIEACGLEGLGLSKDALASLQRAGIKTLEMLVNTKANALSRLGVGRNMQEIKAKLAERGLSLKQAS